MTPFLFERYPQLAESLGHKSLGNSPSPVRALTPLQHPGGASLWLKDDGVFGSVYGGNKVRKLEWLLPELERRRPKSLFTWGGLTTHWGLAAALYARQIGVSTFVSLVDQPQDDLVRAHIGRLGEIADVRWHSSIRAAALAAPLEIARVALADRRRPYLAPPGGSSAFGVLGYVEAGLEIAQQVHSGELPSPNHIVVAVGTGGTAAGLLVGLRASGLQTRVLGVVVTHQLPRQRAVVRGLASRALKLLRKRGANLPSNSVFLGKGLELTRAWLGQGYGHRTQEAEDARALASDRVGLSLDPVYTAKAMAALLALDRRGYFGRDPVLFLNTHDGLSETR